MLKTFKRVISMFVIAAFILSLVPVVGMAEPITKDLTVYDSATIRTGSDSDSTNQWGTTYYYRINGTSRYSYAKIDFTEYMDYLENPSTKFTVTWTSKDKKGGQSFAFYAMDPKADSYDSNNATMCGTYAAGFNMLTFNEDAQIFKYEAADSTSLSYKGTQDLTDGQKATLIENLKADTTNNILTIGFSNNTCSSKTETDLIAFGMKITYDPDDHPETDQEYVERITDELTIDDMVSEAENGVIPSGTELPDKYGDINISWTAEPARYLNGNVLSATDALNADVTLNATFTRGEFVAGKTIPYSAKVAYALGEINDGSEYIATGGGSSGAYEYTAQDKEAAGLGGKALTDEYIKITDTTGGNKYFNLGSGCSALEFSALLTEDCHDEGVGISVAIYLDDEKSQTYYAGLQINKGGIFLDDEKISDGKSLPLNEWINVALVAPTGLIEEPDIYDRTWEVYINGELACETTINSTTNIGFRYNRLNGKNIFDAAVDTSTYLTSIYFDNIRTIPAGEQYIPAIDKEAKVSMNTYDIDTVGKTITLTEAVAIDDIIADMNTDNYTTVRVLDTDGTLVEDSTADVAETYKVVVATTNTVAVERAYSYYTIRMVNGKTAFDAPVISIDTENNKATAYVKAFNYTENPVNYKLYLAVYEDNTLVTVRPAELSATNGTATAINDLEAEILEGQSAKLFVWEDESIGIKPILLAKEVSR